MTPNHASIGKDVAYRHLFSGDPAWAGVIKRGADALSDMLAADDGSVICTRKQLLCGSAWAEADDVVNGYWHAQLLALEGSGDLQLFNIPIGTTPPADRLLRTAQPMLQSALPLGWSVEITAECGRPAESDGCIYQPKVRDSSLMTEWGGSMPLEIGSTTITRTWMHLFTDGGVARWPYGCDHLVIMSLTRGAFFTDRPSLPYFGRICGPQMALALA